MIYRSGQAVSVPVLFASGHPDANVTWTVYDETGAVDTGFITPAVDAVSVTITIDSPTNTLGVGKFSGYRDIEWSYMTAGVSVADSFRYNLEARIPFGVSADGVRSKLGVSKAELPDGDISLMRAYLSFRSAVSTVALAAFDLTNEAGSLAIADAIEATAAIALIPTMAVRVASKESSGTDQFQRQTIDWVFVQAALEGLILAGTIAVLPAYDPTSEYGDIFILAGPATDALTGA